jgi:hypothetical protein
MRCWHSRVYPDRYRGMLDMLRITSGLPGSPRFVLCHRCGVAYICEPDRGESSQTSDRLERQAEQHLQQECPDHAHRFDLQ